MTNPTGRKSGRIPLYAKNQTELGLYLMPPRDRKIIQRAMKLEGCPGRTPDGRYHVGLWQEFVNSHYASADQNPGPDKLKLQNEKLELEIRKLKFDLSVKQREFSANTDIEIWVGDLVMQAKRVLLAIPGKLAPLVVAMTEVEAETAMKEEINVALTQLTARPLHGDQYKPSEPTPPEPPPPPAEVPVDAHAAALAAEPLPLGGGHDYTSPSP